MTSEPLRYSPRRHAAGEFVPVRGLRYHLHRWGEARLATPETPAIVMLHGWMDVGASFQFVVDAMAADRLVIAPDWRGFGSSDRGGGDCYWFPDYLADLDTLLDKQESLIGAIVVIGMAIWLMTLAYDTQPHYRMYPAALAVLVYAAGAGFAFNTDFLQ